ncbi:MAG TPA: hypothetical protein VF688_14380 [Allosphingosinicella sp.]|jgi:hypothetical protein
MSIELRNANPFELLDSINYIDSALFGLSIDLFKIRLFCTFRQSLGLLKLGFEEGGADLCLEFRLIENLKLNMNKSVFGPPYLEDGDLAAGDLFDFDFEVLNLKKVGSTGLTDRLGEYTELRDIHEVHFSFRNASMQFQFVTLEISTFDPLDLDSRYCLSSRNA